jgi:hypothetical protein
LVIGTQPQDESKITKNITAFQTGFVYMRVGQKMSGYFSSNYSIKFRRLLDLLLKRILSKTIKLRGITTGRCEFHNLVSHHLCNIITRPNANDNR